MRLANLDPAWRHLEGWPSWWAVNTALGPPVFGEDAYLAVTCWVYQIGGHRLVDLRLWEAWREPDIWGVPEPYKAVHVTTVMAGAIAESASGPARVAVQEAILCGLGDQLA